MERGTITERKQATHPEQRCFHCGETMANHKSGPTFKERTYAYYCVRWEDLPALAALRGEPPTP